MPDDKPPRTIRNPAKFMESPPAGFDGFFDWSWMLECWPNPRDTPQDIDCFKERRGQVLFVETKDPGVPIPVGQQIAFETLHKSGNAMVMFVWGKDVPRHGEVWFPLCMGGKRIKFEGVEQAQKIVSRWYSWASEKEPEK